MTSCDISFKLVYLPLKFKVVEEAFILKMFYFLLFFIILKYDFIVKNNFIAILDLASHS